MTTNIPGDYRVCPHCGEPYDGAAAPTYCPGCDARLEDDDDG